MFRGDGGWKKSCLVSFDGKIQDKISGVTLSPQGLAVASGDSQQKTIRLLDLLNRLRQGDEVLVL